MTKSVALVTPTYRDDYERFALLCESIDRRVSGHAVHYVVVSDDDLPQFARFAGPRRVVAPTSQFLPRWLHLAAGFRWRGGRKVWWSWRAKPVHGWHVQQFIKIAVSMTMPQQRYLLVDSDIVFFRDFDVAAYAGAESSPLFVRPAAIGADMKRHALWARNSDLLLGKTGEPFPRDDFIGPLIVWDKDAVRAMTAALQRASGKDWVLALCRARDISEYLLYGAFVAASPDWLRGHAATSTSLAVTHWDDVRLDAGDLRALLATASPRQVALCVQSLSHTPIELVREAASADNAGLSHVA